MKVTIRNQNKKPITGLLNFNEREYISSIYECEKQKYILENRLLKIQQNINAKKQLPKFEQTQFYNQLLNGCKPLRELPNEPQNLSAEDYIGPGILSALVFLVSAFFMPFILDTDSFGTLFVVDIMIFIITFTILAIIKKRQYNKEYHSYYVNKTMIEKTNKELSKENEELYASKCKEYENYCKDSLIKAEEYKNSVQSEYDEASKSLKNVRYTLLKLYDYRINGILCLHPNYRGIIPISIIYGYFETGRCTQLQGHEGAYNLYEDEKLKGIIINKLDVVSKQLNRLESSMIYVGQAIQDCNTRLAELEITSNQMINAVNRVNTAVSNRLDDISNQNAQIEANTANASYYSEVSANMTSINTMYNLLK